MDYWTIKENQERANEAMRHNGYEQCEYCTQWTTYTLVTFDRTFSDGRTYNDCIYVYHCCQGKVTIKATNCESCGQFVRTAIDGKDNIITQGICKRCGDGADFDIEDTTDTANAVCPHCGK